MLKTAEISSKHLLKVLLYQEIFQTGLNGVLTITLMAVVPGKQILSNLWLLQDNSALIYGVFIRALLKLWNFLEENPPQQWTSLEILLKVMESKE